MRKMEETVTLMECTTESNDDNLDDDEEEEELEEDVMTVIHLLVKIYTGQDM